MKYQALINDLLAAQRRDGARAWELLEASNRALDARDYAEARRLGEAADDVMATIRSRSRVLAQLVDEPQPVSRGA